MVCCCLKSFPRSTVLTLISVPFLPRLAIASTSDQSGALWLQHNSQVNICPALRVLPPDLPTSLSATLSTFFLFLVTVLFPFFTFCLPTIQLKTSERQRGLLAPLSYHCGPFLLFQVVSASSPPCPTQQETRHAATSLRFKAGIADATVLLQRPPMGAGLTF